MHPNWPRLFSLIIAALQLTGQIRAANYQGGYKTNVSTAFSNESSPPAPGGYLVMDLGTDREPLDVNNRGTVLLRRPRTTINFFYRWKTTNLGQGVEELLVGTTDQPRSVARGLNNNDEIWGYVTAESNFQPQAGYWPGSDTTPQLWFGPDSLPAGWDYQATHAYFFSDNRRFWINRTLKNSSATHISIFSSVVPGKQDELFSEFVQPLYQGDDMAVFFVAQSGDMEGYYYRYDDALAYYFVGRHPQRGFIPAFRLTNRGTRINARGLVLLPEYIAANYGTVAPLYLWDLARPDTYRFIGIANTSTSSYAVYYMGLSTPKDDRDPLVIVNEMDVFIENVNDGSPELALQRYPAQSLLPTGSSWRNFRAVTVSNNARYIVGLADDASSLKHTILLARLDGIGFAVDANRDGTIKLASEDASDATSADQPFRFWVNDDDDLDDVSGNDIPNPSSSSDGAAATNFEGDGMVDGTRDLVDFFPVFLNIKELLTVLPSSSFKYKLKHEDGALNFVYTKLTRADAQKYQTEDRGAIYGPLLNESVANAGTRRIGPAGVELASQFLAGIQDQDWGVILVEAWQPTVKPLVLAVEKDGAVIAELKLELNISSVEDMYRWINLRDVAGQPVARATAIDEPANYPDSMTNGKMFVFLHGYNVNEEQSRGWGAEVFKRLYQAGSRAMFTTVSWHGDHSQIPYIGVAPDYWENVTHAFITAQALPAAVNSLPGSSKIIAGHSIGNIVVSSAIADHGLSVSNYFMLHAAVALEAYDTTAMSIDAMRHPDWASYETRLWSTEWHNLFPTDDGRRGLTWRNRFGNIANATNFYSSGEDVLNNNDATPGQVPSVGGERAWVLQEMVKGTNHPGAVLTFDVQGGWGFNSWWDIPTFVPDDSDAGGYYVYNRRTPAEAATLTDDQLRTQTFFLPFQDTRFVSATAGSAAAAEYLARADALGGAIPALSFAAGRNPVPRFEDQLRNIDLMSYQDGWPQARLDNEATRLPDGRGRWLHSDAKKVAYRYIHELWESFINIGNLK